MKTRLFSVAAVFVLLSTVLAVGSASGDPAESSAEEVSAEVGVPDEVFDPDRYLGYWLDFRYRHQLSVDVDETIKLASTKVGRDAILEFSAPLTKNEQEQVLARWDREEEISELMPKLEALPGYGGLYFDNDNGGELVVGFTNTDAKRLIEGDLAAATLNQGKLRLKQVDHSLAELRVAQDAILAGESKKRPEDLVVRSIAIDERNNRLEIGVGSDQNADDKLTPSQKRDLETELKADSDVTFTIEDAAVQPVLHCPNRSHCGDAATPKRGGIRVHEVNGGDRSCTSGFIATRNTGQPVALTAGHCSISFDQERMAWGRPGATAHLAARNIVANNYQWNFDPALAPTIDADALAWNIPPSVTSHHYYKGPSAANFRVIQSVARAGHPVGGNVCLGSWKTGEHMVCGQIEAVGINQLIRARFGGNWIYTRIANHVEISLVTANLPDIDNTRCDMRLGGISGAGVFNNKRAYGTISSCRVRAGGLVPGVPGGLPGTTVYRVVYSRIAQVEQALNVTVNVN